VFCSNAEHQDLFRQWDVVHVTASEFESDAIEKNLTTIGIPVCVFSMRAFSEAFWLGEQAIVRVLVKKGHREDALRHLDNLQLLSDELNR